jgi:glycosyltransferase involved in cell wall biosynthesis
MEAPKYSVIVPVFNRPHEVEELLDSLTRQHFRDFEVLIIDDGSTNRCDEVVDKFRDRLAVQYYFKPNSGPGPSRNYGFIHARGDYFILVDSDCILPDTYFQAIEESLAKLPLDAWGGPDRAMTAFTPMQRAMGYTMSSFLTTGGIRGGQKRVTWFQPRSFNMGLAKRVFRKTGGFKLDRYAEDIEFSVRMKKEGFKIGLIQDAFVYHKRRTNWQEFYRQVFNFGKGRALVGRYHPGEVKLAHWLPTLFVLYVISLPFLFLFAPVLFTAGFGLLLIYFIAIFFHAWVVNQNLAVAFLAVPSAAIQLLGYGAGFFEAWFRLFTAPKK